MGEAIEKEAIHGLMINPLLHNKSASMLTVDLSEHIISSAPTSTREGNREMNTTPQSAQQQSRESQVNNMKIIRPPGGGDSLSSCETVYASTMIPPANRLPLAKSSSGMMSPKTSPKQDG